MKKTLTLLLLVAVFHIAMNAQWNLSRFDQLNTFTNISIPQTNVAYAIGNEPTSGNCFLLKTIDNGITWDSISLSPITEVLSVYDIHFRTTQNGFISGYKNSHQFLIATQDGGLTWTEITPDVNSPNGLLAIHFVNENLGFASSYNHLYRTEDGGSSWTDILLDFDINDISFLDENIGFYCGYNQLTSDASMMKTIDGGLSWYEVLTASVPDLFVSQFGTIDIIDATSIYTHVKFTNNIFRSFDAGESWTMFELPVEFAGITDFDFTSSTKGHVLTYDGQIWSTLDGGINWTMEYATESGSYGPFVYFHDLAISGSAGFVVGSKGLIKRYTEGLITNVAPAEKPSFEIYPNPMQANEVLTIHMPQEVMVKTVTLINDRGQVVYSRGVTQSGDRIAVPSLNLASGLYFIQLITSEGTFEKRVVVVN